MGREWQQTRFKEFVMPDAVYYQVIWAVRDLQRMEDRIKAIARDVETGAIHSASLVSDGNNNYSEIRPTEKTALEKAMLESRVKAIRSALDLVPEAYRSFIMDNIVLKTSVKAFPNKLWRVWKQRFLYNAAQNLSLIC